MQIESRDLSLGGVFLFTTTPEPLGTAVSLELHLDDGQAISAQATVMYSMGGVGMGLQFESFSGDGRQALEQWLLGFAGERAAPTVSGRRLHRRAALERDGRLMLQGTTSAGVVLDVSEGGLFLATDQRLPIGTEVELEFSLPDGPPISVRGEVRWHRAHAEAARNGMGLRFLQPAPADRRRIAAYVEGERLRLGDQLVLQPVGGEDRRAHRRIPIETEVSFGSETTFYTGFTRDLGSGGLFVAADPPLPIGTGVDLRFSLPDEGPAIAVRAEVRWLRVQDAGDAQPGMGLRFLDLAPEDLRRIEGFVAQRESLFYDDAD
jgi:uncharacterized protein (TIGR02266 family)